MKKSIATTYLIGLPIGLFFIFYFLFAMVSSMDTLMFVLFGPYVFTPIGLIVAFILSLWWAGRSTYNMLEEGHSLVLTSFVSSAIVNGCVWGMFILITIITAGINFVILPIFFFFFCLVASSFTINLLIVYVIKRRLETEAPSEDQLLDNF